MIHQFRSLSKSLKDSLDTLYLLKKGLVCTFRSNEFNDGDCNKPQIINICAVNLPFSFFIILVLSIYSFISQSWRVCALLLSSIFPNLALVWIRQKSICNGLSCSSHSFWLDEVQIKNGYKLASLLEARLDIYLINRNKSIMKSCFQSRVRFLLWIMIFLRLERGVVIN